MTYTLWSADLNLVSLSKLRQLYFKSAYAKKHG